jgi:hypothetical protein
MANRTHEAHVDARLQRVLSSHVVGVMKQQVVPTILPLAHPVYSSVLRSEYT